MLRGAVVPTLNSQLLTLNLPHPRRDVLMKTFLHLYSGSDGKDRSLRKMFAQQCDEERLRRRVDAVERQRSAMLRALKEGLHSGSTCDSRENVLFPFDQAGNSQRRNGPSRQPRALKMNLFRVALSQLHAHSKAGAEGRQIFVAGVD